MTQQPGSKRVSQKPRTIVRQQPSSKAALGPKLPPNPDLTPVGALLPTLTFVGHCLGCERDTLFALVKLNNVNHYFCSLCGQYTPIDG